MFSSKDQTCCCVGEESWALTLWFWHVERNDSQSGGKLTEDRSTTRKRPCCCRHWFFWESIFVIFKFAFSELVKILKLCQASVMNQKKVCQNFLKIILQGLPTENLLPCPIRTPVAVDATPLLAPQYLSSAFWDTLVNPVWKSSFLRSKQHNVNQQAKENSELLSRSFRMSPWISVSTSRFEEGGVLSY